MNNDHWWRDQRSDARYIRVISVWLLRLKWNQAIHLHSLIDKKSPPGQTCCSSDHKGVRRITCNQRLMGLWNNMKYWIMSLSLTFGKPSRQVFATGISIDPDFIKTNIITILQMHKGVDLSTKIFTRINLNTCIYLLIFYLITHTNSSFYAGRICKIAWPNWKIPVFPQFLFGFIIKHHNTNFFL